MLQELELRLLPKYIVSTENSSLGMRVAIHHIAGDARYYYLIPQGKISDMARKFILKSSCS